MNIQLKFSHLQEKKLFQFLFFPEMYHQIWALAGLSIYSLLNRVAAQPDIPEVVFDCSVTPGACTNMCWGAYCSGYEVSLSFDKPSKKVKRDRRAKAGCGKGNRCGDQSPDPDGNSCDEYPFASVQEADNVQQVNRCIPGSEQDSAFLPIRLTSSTHKEKYHFSFPFFPPM